MSKIRNDMFGLKAKLPISEDDRRWVDDSFQRLERVLSRERMTNAEVILPTPNYFPDPYEADQASLDRMFRRVCGYMRLDPDIAEVNLFADQAAELSKALPYWHGKHQDAAGIYMKSEGRPVVGVKESQLKNPLQLVATLAHELCHVMLLGPSLIAHDDPDMEPLTDLATVFVGMGVFTANAARNFEQHQDETRQGWAMSIHGYLPEQVIGYALAKFAHERNEKKPTWADHLRSNVKSDYRHSKNWIEQHMHTSSVGR